MTVLLDEVEALYEGAVTRPSNWTDVAIADWAAGVATTTEVDKVSGKHLRRIVRVSGKLQQFWDLDRRLDDPAIDWRSRVDMAMGPRAWRPVLELATHLLTNDPSNDLYVRVADLFRVVNGAQWMEGVTYDQWLLRNQRN